MWHVCTCVWRSEDALCLSQLFSTLAFEMGVSHCPGAHQSSSGASQQSQQSSSVLEFQMCTDVPLASVLEVTLSLTLPRQYNELLSKNKSLRNIQAGMLQKEVKEKLLCWWESLCKFLMREEQAWKVGGRVNISVRPEVGIVERWKWQDRKLWRLREPGQARSRSLSLPLSLPPWAISSAL